MADTSKYAATFELLDVDGDGRLSAAELKRLGEVLTEMAAERIEHPHAISAIRLLVLTGCRLNEIMKLRWEDVDMPAGMLRLPDSKTGAKVVQLDMRPATCLGRSNVSPSTLM